MCLLNVSSIRFFSILEIGNTPFVTGSGPTDFGELHSVRNVFVHDGHLGLSSHHGIHSNGARDVVIENMEITDFEVAAVQFNGFSGVQINNVRIGPSAQNVLR